jgi:hypothetical protein
LLAVKQILIRQLELNIDLQIYEKFNRHMGLTEGQGKSHAAMHRHKSPLLQFHKSSALRYKEAVAAAADDDDDAVALRLVLSVHCLLSKISMIASNDNHFTFWASHTIYVKIISHYFL